MTTRDQQSTDEIVYIVDDNPSVRKALTRMFKTHGMPVTTFESARDFLDCKRADVPGCLLLDVQMPGQTGIELQEELLAHHVDLPIVFMTAHGDIPMTVKAMQNGAIDFLQKPVDDEQLLETVRRAIDRNARKRQVSAGLREFLQRVESLSKREYEVLTLVITGKLNKQIARQLGITEHTIKVHRGRVMGKTGVDSIAELVRLCEKAGISAKTDLGSG